MTLPLYSLSVKYGPLIIIMFSLGRIFIRPLLYYLKGLFVICFHAHHCIFLFICYFFF